MFKVTSRKIESKDILKESSVVLNSAFDSLIGSVEIGAEYCFQILHLTVHTVSVEYFVFDLNLVSDVSVYVDTCGHASLL